MVGLQLHILADLPYVLARKSDDDGFLKLIGLAIIVVIWVVGAIASAIQKASKKREQDLAAARLSGVANRPPNAPPSTPYKAMAPPVRVAPPPIQQQKQRKRAKQQLAVAAPLEAVAPRAELTAAPPIRRAATARPSLNATTIRRWLKPGVMQKQYVLTELFDPPPSAEKQGR